MHIGILGQSESGKSLLAKCLILQFRQRGMKSIVLDPLADPSFGADFSTTNEDEFLSVVWRSRSCLVLADEMGDHGKFNHAISQLATKGRHWGHTCIFLGQKGTQINPLVRDQWGAVFSFTGGKASGKILAEEFNSDAFLNIPSLPQFEYIFKTRFQEPVFGDVRDLAKKLGIFKG